MADSGLRPARVYHTPPPLPVSGPRITPAEAIAIGLSTALARPFTPECLAVQLALLAIRNSGWRITAAASETEEKA
jgi:hypothetical protein